MRYCCAIIVLLLASIVGCTGVRYHDCGRCASTTFHTEATPANPSPPVTPRFHPVPTRPVFESREPRMNNDS